MGNKQLKRLNRAELIDIIYQLRLDNEELEEKLRETTALLEEKTIRIKESGSIAEASLALNGIFAAAQNAADQYLLSVKASDKEQEEKIRKTENQCQALLEAAIAESEKTRMNAERQCREMLEAMEQEISQRKDAFQMEINHASRNGIRNGTAVKV